MYWVFEKFKVSDMAEKLSDELITRLARVISKDNCEGIALINLGFTTDEVRNIWIDCQQNSTKFNRTIFETWRNRNPDNNHKQVSACDKRKLDFSRKHDQTFQI